MFLALSSVAYAQKASGGNKEKGAAGAGEAVAHIELAAVTLMSKVIRRGFYHLFISISLSSILSLVSLLFFLLYILSISYGNYSHQGYKPATFSFFLSFFLTFCFAAHKYPRTAGSFNAEPMETSKNFFLATHSTPVIPVACSFHSLSALFFFFFWSRVRKCETPGLSYGCHRLRKHTDKI